MTSLDRQASTKFFTTWFPRFNRWAPGKTKRISWLIKLTFHTVPNLCKLLKTVAGISWSGYDNFGVFEASVGVFVIDMGGRCYKTNQSDSHSHCTRLCFIKRKGATQLFCMRPNVTRNVLSFYKKSNLLGGTGNDFFELLLLFINGVYLLFLRLSI